MQSRPLWDSQHACMDPTLSHGLVKNCRGDVQEAPAHVHNAGHHEAGTVRMRATSICQW